jgi:hypothetical protein
MITTMFANCLVLCTLSCKFSLRFRFYYFHITGLGGAKVQWSFNTYQNHTDGSGRPSSVSKDIVLPTSAHSHTRQRVLGTQVGKAILWKSRENEVTCKKKGIHNYWLCHSCHYWFLVYLFQFFCFVLFFGLYPTSH